MTYGFDPSSTTRTSPTARSTESPRAVGELELRPRHVRRLRHPHPQLVEPAGPQHCEPGRRRPRHPTGDGSISRSRTPTPLLFPYVRRMLGCSPATGCVRSLTAWCWPRTLFTIAIVAGDGVRFAPVNSTFLHGVSSTRRTTMTVLSCSFAQSGPAAYWTVAKCSSSTHSSS
jgi:hypothetical protein